MLCINPNIIHPEEYKLVVNNQYDIQGLEKFLNRKIKVSELEDLKSIREIYEHEIKNRRRA